nr:MAG TPA_asm: hypothetical protein [Bacteriophage sp.]
MLSKFTKSVAFINCNITRLFFCWSLLLSNIII